MSVPLRPLAIGPSRGPDGGRAVSHYREQPAPPTIAGVAACTWTGQPGWARSLRVLPDGCADLVWDGDRLRFVAPAAGPVRLSLDGAATPIGIRLRPGLAGHIAGLRVDDLPPVSGLAELWTAAVARRTLARSTAALLAATDPGGRRDALVGLVAARLADVGAPDDRLRVAVAHLVRPATGLRDAAEQSGISPRHLRRRLRAEAGLGATDLHRVFRFQRFLRAIDAHDPDVPGARRTPPLADLAAAGGYADQAHLTRECRRLSGSTPASLVRGRLAGPGAAAGPGPRR